MVNYEKERIKMKEFLESLKSLTVDIAEGMIAITVLILIAVAITTIGGVLVAIASTGIGAIVIIWVIYRVWVNSNDKEK